MSTETEHDIEHDPDPDGDRGRKMITFTVDGEPVTTTDPTLTPRQIMKLVGVNPVTNYLVQIKGRHQTSYRDDPDVEIRVHKDDTFFTISTGPTPVS